MSPVSLFGELTSQLGEIDDRPEQEQNKQHVRYWQRLQGKIKLGREYGGGVEEVQFLVGWLGKAALKRGFKQRLGDGVEEPCGQ